ncbi:MAG: hypothetical protein E6G42_10415 [Actinobacteria bacterium]|nr:MAG: hypothetical protein E6G42_10415 [Actinomycetota bacterium]
MLQTSTQGAPVADRLTVGVAARLSRYLQVLTQARKMGKDRISSQEEARGGLQHRQPPGGDPQDPPHPGPAQHRARRCRQARPGDRQLVDLRRARDQHRRGLRH